MDMTELTTEHTRPYEGLIVHVDLDRVSLPNGHAASREVVHHPGGVAILPLNDDGTVTVVRQFRYPFAQVLTEIPAGKIEEGEDPRDCAVRELGEEIGAQAGELIDLGTVYPSPGFCHEMLYLYLARNLTYGPCHPDEDEFLEVVRIPFERMAEQVMNGQLRDGKTVTAVLKTKILLNL